MNGLGAGLPEPARKELFSLAYLSAIAAATQCEVWVPKMDYDSLDAMVHSTRGRRPQFWMQLKATANDCIDDGHLVFDLPIKNYNDLRTSERIVPVMLVVLHLPELEEHWLTHDADLLMLRNSAYYFNLLGMPDTDNERTIRIRIPTEQRLTKESLAHLLDHFQEHKRLP